MTGTWATAAPMRPRTARELAGPYYWSGPEGLALISEGLCPVDLARLVPDGPLGICPVCAMGYWVRGPSDEAGPRAGCVQTYKQV